MAHRTWLLLAAFASVGAAIAADAQARPSTGASAQVNPPTAGVPATQATTTLSSYELGIDDEVQVSLFGQPDMTLRTRVQNDGTIPYPLLGNLRVAGMRVGDVAAMIAQRLRAGGYYNKPVVSVDVTSYASKAFTLFGSFGTPGIYPLDREITVAAAIARGGGVRTDGADFALLRRKGDTHERRIEFTDLSDTTGINLQLQPGDTLVVPTAPQVYVYGQVGAPGSYPVKGRMTLRQALIRAGGLTLAGNEKSVTLRRKGEVIKRIDLNQEVQPDDVLFVNERFF